MYTKDCGGALESGCDWLLASLVCQAIWNYSIDNNNQFDCIDNEEISELDAVLYELASREAEVFRADPKTGQTVCQVGVSKKVNKIAK